MPRCQVAAAFAALWIASCAESREPLLLPAYIASPDVVAAMTHRARGERWELRASSVEMHGPTGSRVVELPGATQSASRDSCPPDLLLDRSGAAYVSSNATPVIWRVDAGSQAVERLEIRLEEDTGRDIGFSRLAWAAEGRAVYAMSSPPGALWRIDLEQGSAAKVRDAAGEACGTPWTVTR